MPRRAVSGRKSESAKAGVKNPMSQMRSQVGTLRIRSGFQGESGSRAGARAGKPLVGEDREEQATDRRPVDAVGGSRVRRCLRSCWTVHPALPPFAIGSRSAAFRLVEHRGAPPGSSARPPGDGGSAPSGDGPPGSSAPKIQVGPFGQMIERRARHVLGLRQLAEVAAPLLEGATQGRGIGRAQHEREHVDAPVVPLGPRAPRQARGRRPYVAPYAAM